MKADTLLSIITDIIKEHGNVTVFFADGYFWYVDKDENFHSINYR